MKFMLFLHLTSVFILIKTIPFMNKVFFLAAACMLMMSSCRYSNGRRVRGDGRETTEQRNVTGFTGVETDGSIDIVVSKGAYKVNVKADGNLQQYVITEVVNGKLTVRFKSNMSFIDFDDITVYVSAPDVNEFESHGSGNIKGEGRMTDSNKMKVNIFGSGDIELEVDCPSIESEIHGSGNVSLSGETKNFTCAIHGSGDIKASDLKTENVKVSIHGSGNADVFASESLDAEISASGDVHYKGEPKITSSVHGSGEVSKME
jgi:Putative auto-transporter adhesin, head GIN domain